MVPANRAVARSAAAGGGVARAARPRWGVSPRSVLVRGVPCETAWSAKRGRQMSKGGGVAPRVYGRVIKVIKVI